MSYIYQTNRIELHKQIEHHANFIKGRVLDIGAGTFPRYKNLFSYDEYVTMDVEERAGIDLVGRIEKIPSLDSSFDSIVCTQVLGDVYDLNKSFNELFRVLRPGGTVLITENLFDPLHDEPNDFWRFTEHSLRRLAEDSGFNVKVLKGYGGYRSVMAQMKTRYWIERLGAHKRWFSRLFSLVLKIRGTLACFLDSRDRNDANKLFVHGYILIAQKNA